jgi:hypothetical protein
MGRKLEWELSGKSDVPQKMAEAKGSVDAFSRASDGISRKFRDAFKDIALGFIAPMILVQKAIGFITDKIEEAKRKAQEARDFAKDEESKKYAAAGGREAILQYMEQEKENENRKKAADLVNQGYQKFLTNDPRGKAILEEYKKKEPGMAGAGGIVPVEAFAAVDDEVRKKIEAAIAPDVAARQAAEDAKKGGDKAKDATAKATGPEVGSNVVGVGMSPQLEAMRQQTDLLSSIDMTLRGIVNAGVHPSSANLTEKGQVGSQAPSGFLFGYTQVLGSRISR